MQITSRSYKLMAIALVFVLIVGCGNEAEVPELSFGVDTVAGVERRWNSGSAPELVAERVLRIGAVDEGPAAFGRIQSIIANERGDVYIADNPSREVRLFGAEGEHLQTFGRRGGGPGEFGDLYGLAWLESDLVALDPGNARIGRFSPQGDWLEGIRHVPLSGPGTLIRLHPLGDSAFYAPTVDSRRVDLPFVRISGRGMMDTIGAPRAPDSAPQFWSRCERPDGGIQGIVIPDAPTTVFAFPPMGGRVATAWTAGYRIAFRSPAGDTIYVVERMGTALPYSDSVWEEALRPMREIHEEYPGTRCEPTEPARPRTRSVLRSIAFDEVGSMWVEAATPDGYAWDIFDIQGRLLGSAPAPRRDTTVPVYVRDERLYQVEVDDFGVQYVVGYRLRPASNR